METKYYDIGLNLFTRSFPDPEKIIRNAEEAGVRCILTGSEARENELVADFVKIMTYGARQASIRTAPIRRRKKMLSASESLS